MKRLSQPIGKLKPHYAVVVVGSGYGGAIAASRLARAGQKVCVLERGCERQPGEYPDNPLSAGEEFQIDTPDGHEGRSTGLYDLRVNPEIDVFVGCGLGGTSQINANVALEADPRVFADTCWPDELRNDLQSRLKDGYKRAKAMLQPEPYPHTAPAKLQALQRSATALGASLSRPDINVTFEDRDNPAGIHQPGCNGCGDCCSGCNVGSKNTVLMNYLPDAVHHGAEIYTEVAVRWLERRGDSWAIHYQLAESGRERFDAPELVLMADVVVLAAGTLGSTEILLRSKERGLQLSNQLGRRFSGNGDVLAFAYNADQEINGIGFGDNPADGRAQVGPCITGLIDMRDPQQPLDRGMILEDGSIPGALAAVLPPAFALGARAVGQAAPGADQPAAAGREFESLLHGAYTGADRHTQTFLVMGHDGSGGTMALVNDRLRISWSGLAGQHVFREADARLKTASDALNATYIRNPGWKLMRNLISVHPLGGCAMGADASQGVVDHKGQVFAGTAGTDLQPDLYVCDGAVVPRSLGANPLLTISALAERSCGYIADQHTWTIDYTDKRGPGPPAVKPGLQFTERMTGFWSRNVTDDYKRGAQQGEQDGSGMSLVLTITCNDLEATLNGSGDAESVIGTVAIPGLSPEQLMVYGGEFNFFVPDPNYVETKRMLYRLPTVAEDGTRYFIELFKVFNTSPVTQLWTEATTAYVTVREGADANGAVVGRGIVHISPGDFEKQMLTMRALNLDNPLERVSAVARFNRFFAGELVESFGGIFARPSLFDPNAPPRGKRPLNAGTPEVHDFQTDDLIHLRLTRYRGGDKGPVILGHAYGVSSTMFSLDTIDTNFVEFLYKNSYDVWALDYRASPIYNASTDKRFTEYSLDDIAKRDWPAAVQKVQAVTGKHSVQAVVHCIGSVTFFMAMLAGLRGVRSIIACQVAAHPIPGLPSRVKAAIHAPGLLYRLGLKTFRTDESTNSSYGNRLLDVALRLTTPIGRGDDCNSPVCWRVNFLYGVSFLHAQLNQATHDAIHEFFGFASMRSMTHIARIVRAGHVVAEDGTESYMRRLDRLKLPILFLQGAHNEVFVPVGTAETYKVLCRANGKQFYERIVLPSYGHLDCFIGRRAAEEVYPDMLHHLEATQ